MSEDDDVLAGLEFDVDEPIVIDLTDLHPSQRTSKFLVEQVQAGAVVNVVGLADHELSAFRNWVRQALLQSGQMHTPPEHRTPDAEALHSVWIACHVEWQKRRPS